MFTKQLDLGTRDSQVKELQQFLNKLGIKVAESGPGSPGNETDYYGPLTQKAVQVFQEKYQIVNSGTPTSTGYGRVGLQTLTKLTEVSKSGARNIFEESPFKAPSEYEGTYGEWITPSGQGVSGKWKPGYVPATQKKEPTKKQVAKVGEDGVEKTDVEIKKEVVDAGAGAGDGAGGEDPTINVEGDINAPDWLENNEGFQQLSPDQQRYVVNFYNVLTIDDEERQKRYVEALEEAKASADPYFAEMVRIAQSELLTALGEQKGDFASQDRDLKLKIEQINEDLATGKGRLSVDQQAELSRRKRQYEVGLENLQEEARTRGLTFSSKRSLAESRLAQEQSDIVESTKRTFQRKIEDLQMASARGETEATNLLKDYERVYGENITKLTRGTEKVLGTEGLPDLSEFPGVKPLTGVSGSLKEEKAKDILTRAEEISRVDSLSSLRNPFL